MSQEIPEEKVTVIRLYSSLIGTFVDSEDYHTAFSAYSLCGYEHEIKNALNSDWIQSEKGGLAQYLNDSRLQNKIISMYPSVEVWKCNLLGVLEIKSREELNPEELEALKFEWHGQMTDGWGEGFEQHPIKTDDGELYVSFWHSGSDFFITPEQRLKQQSEQNFRIQMGGI